MLDQALNALSVMLALGEHRLGTADCEVVYEGRGWPIRLHQGRDAVQRFCKRWILSDGYARKASRHGAYGSTRVQHLSSPKHQSSPNCGRSQVAPEGCT